ncbi:MAG: hypothetical protein NTW96_27570 [Planctomycetia bacterium]|nr:hypothetical protein [Planctomycetia bacterium]
MFHDPAGAGYLVAVGVPTRFCTTGPAVAVTVNSLSVTVASDTAAPGILASSNGGNLTIGTLNFIEGTPTTTITGGNVFGESTARPKLSGVGTMTVAPRAVNVSNYATTRLDVLAGAALTVTILPRSGTDTALDTQMDFGGATAGTVTINGNTTTALGRVQGSNNYTAASTAVYNINCNAGTVSFPCLSAGSVLNLGTGYALLMGPFPTLPLAGTINARGSLAIYSPNSVLVAAVGTVIEGYAPVTLVNCDVGTNLLTINMHNNYPYTPVDVTGTYTVTGAVGGAPYPAAADVRYGTATGGLTGTLRVPAAGDVREGTPVDAGVGTLAIGPVFLL